MRLTAALLFSSFTAFCGLTTCTSKTDGTSSETIAPATSNSARRTNLTILLDLSNRINATYGQDNQQNRDVAIVKAASTWFKNRIEKQGAIKAKDRFAVYFEPQPQMDAGLDQVARSLQIDLGKPGMQPKERKVIYNNVDQQTSVNILRLYEFVRKQPYMGADIWGFAKEKMAARCIMDTTKYRNVLVLVTDGYLDHVRNRTMKQGNKSAFFNDAYINNELVKKGHFTPANWPAKYDAGHYGLLVPSNTNLKGLEVLVLEINTYSRPPFYTDIVKRYVTDWFKAMGVKHVEAHPTDIPTDTEQNLNSFLDKE